VNGAATRILAVLLVVDILLVLALRSSSGLDIVLAGANAGFHVFAFACCWREPKRFAAWRIGFLISGLFGLWVALQSRHFTAFLALAVLVLCWLLQHSELLKRFRPRLLLALLLLLFLPLGLAQLAGPPLAQLVASGAPAASSKSRQSVKERQSQKTEARRQERRAETKKFDPGSLSLDSPEPETVPELVATLKFLPDGPPPPRAIHYLRETAFVSFDGRRWFSPPRSARRIRDGDDGALDSWVNFGSGRGARPLNYEITLAAGGATHLPVLPGLRRLRLPQIDCDENQAFKLPVAPPAGFVYQALSIPVFYAQCPPDSVLPGRAEAACLEIPRGAVYEEIRRTAEAVAAPLSTPAGKIAALQRHLQENYSYELSQHRHSLEDFFLRRKRGHCTLFASTFTFMLRSLKIPARVAIGYPSSRFDDLEGSYGFFTDQRHAWCEIFLEKYGWVGIDPTPAVALQEPASAAPSAGAESLEEEAAEEPVGAPQAGSAAVGSPGAAWLILILLAALSIFLKVPEFVRRRRELQSELRQRPGYSPVGEFYRIFCQTFHQLGAPRQEGETGRDYLVRLKARGLIGGEFDDLIDYHYRIRYGGAPAEVRREEEFIARLDQLRRQGGR
jgi:hypothetical protein